MDLQIAEFKKVYPDYEFELNSVAGYSHQEALLMMLAAGTGPDCWFDSIRTTGMLARKGVVLADGRRVSVLNDWSADGATGDFLRRIHESACKRFPTGQRPQVYSFGNAIGSD